MCRLSAFIATYSICAADLVTRPSRSIITQSFDARESPSLNGDGFGLGYYASDRTSDPTPCVYKQAKPAWNDCNLGPISAKVKTPILFAHVRAASPGLDVSEKACHPFRFSRWLFMHNGMIGEFGKVRRKMMAMLDDESFGFVVQNGSSDTVVCFALFLTLLNNKDERVDADVVRAKMEEMIGIVRGIVDEEDVGEVSILNFVVSDGHVLVATRFMVNPVVGSLKQCASLYFAAGNEYKPGLEGAKGSYRMIHKDRRATLAMISSEPLTDDKTDWIPVPVNHVVIITENIHILLSPIHGRSYVARALENISSPSVASISPPTSQLKLEENVNGDTQLLESSSSSESVDQMKLNGLYLENSLRYVIGAHKKSVLTLVVYNGYLFGGSQDGCIRVWNIKSQECVAELCGHKGGVLALQMDKKKGWLLSASADSMVCIWSNHANDKFKRLHQFALEGKGEIFSLSRVDDTIFAGYADTYVRCFDEGCLEAKGNDHRLLGGVEYERRHCGYIYALATCKDGKYLCTGCADGFVRIWDVASGECVKVLEGHKGGVMTLVSVKVNGSSLLFSGARDATVKCWDVDFEFACRRTIRAHKEEVVSVVAAGDKLLTGSIDGQVNVWCAKSLKCVARWKESSLQAAAIDTEENLVFVALRDRSIVARDLIPNSAEARWEKASFGNETKREATKTEGGTLAVASGEHDASLPHVSSGASQINGFHDQNGCAEVSDEPERAIISKKQVSVIPRGDAVSSKRLLQDVFGRFISHASVPGNEAHREGCWGCAKFLMTFLESLGANVHCATSSDSSHNPLVIARFSSPSVNAANVVFYGHYDVMPANKKSWDTDPWKLTSKDGYFYGRGVTDNKGPILAVAFAIKELMENSKEGLSANVTMILEGEGENSNVGFRETVTKNSHWFINTDVILTSNSYWLGENRPCITYGMRGVVDLEITVSGPKKNLHSGVDGGVTVEVLSDLIGILGSLSDSNGKCMIVGFYDEIREFTAEDEQMLSEINFDVERYIERTGVNQLRASNAVDILRKRWRLPSISIADICSSNSGATHSVVPNVAKASVSCRFVPDQSLSDMETKLRSHISLEFAKRKSPNKLDIETINSGDWWLENPKLPANQVAEKAIQAVWGMPPLYVCEGGTMPIFSFLKEELRAPVLQIPLGQSTDGAHLPNERIRVVNLLNGIEVLKRVLQGLNVEEECRKAA